MPPAVVADRLYEAEQLRRMPLLEAVSGVVGAPANDAARTPAQLAAQEAHMELIAMVSASRHPLRGEHVNYSTHETAQRLARQGSQLLVAAYGASAGVTLVRGDDALWDALAGGIAARIAVRHLAVFERSELQRRISEGGDATDVLIHPTVMAAANSWRHGDRSLVDAFAKAWVAVAAQPSAVATALAPLDLKQKTTLASRRFARVRALTEDVKALLAVASFAHELLRQDPKVREMVLADYTTSSIFKDQSSLQMSDHTRATVTLSNGTWASRRIDSDAQRSKVGKGVDETIRAMAALNIAPEETSRFPMHYYCPLGSRLDALPGRRPFDLIAHGERMLWLELLQKSLTRVRTAMRVDNVPEPGAGRILVGDYADVAEGRLQGFARHPLVVTSYQGAVGTCLAAREVYGLNSVPLNKPVPNTLVDAYELFNSTSGAELSGVRTQSTLARIAAFDADRMVNAVGLAATRLRPGDVVYTSVINKSSALSLAMALAMYETEAAGLQTALEVYVETEVLRASLDKDLETTAFACDSALKAGCKVVPLTEACVALV